MNGKNRKFCRFTGCLALAGTLATLTTLASPPEAAARISDRAIAQARLCTQHFPRHERLHGIPTHLLAAIAATESGRWNDTLGMTIPWPWTLNADGKGYYFDSKAEAVRKIRQLKRRGADNIDVGCMQVSLKHHPNAFRSLEQALDPKYNVAYAAEFLSRNYDEMRSWTKATAAYHSRTPHYGKRYLGRVEKSWNTIVGKVRQARARRGSQSSQYAVRVAEQEREVAALSQAFDNTEFANTKPAAASSPGKRRKAMKVIEVHGNAAPRQQATLIVKPTYKGDAKPLKADDGSALQTVASVSSDVFVTQHGEAKTRSTSSSDADSPALRRGPKFVFVE